MADLSRSFRSSLPVHIACPTTPPWRCHRDGLGSAPFARRYWGYHCCFLFLPVLRCFSSRGLPPRFIGDDRSSTGRVDPFGHARITGRLHLPAPFRSLPRPSSPSGATGIRRAPFFPFAAPVPPRASVRRWLDMRAHAYSVLLVVFFFVSSRSCDSSSLLCTQAVARLKRGVRRISFLLVPACQ